MAKIQVFPLSINGINSPLNLIDQVLAPTNYQDNLLYPIDLATNPQFCHAIQFTVYDYTFPKIAEAYGQFVNNVVPTAFKAAAAAKSTITEAASQIGNQSLSQTAGQAKSILGVAESVAKNVTPEQLVNSALSGASLLNVNNFKGGTVGTALSTISLYLPDTLTTSFDSDYTSISLTETFGISGYLSTAVSDKKTKDAVTQATTQGEVTNLLNTELGKSITAAALGKIIGGQGVFQQALGVIPNPQLQLLYKGIGLREFQFEFIFTPTSSQEADSVNQIINTFLYYSLPEISGPESMYYKPPQVFKINFAYTGDQGAFSQIGQVLTNTITQALGTQLSGLFGPGAQNQNNLIKNSKQAKIFEIKDCVLSNVQLDYAPNGWAAYQDGFPIQTRMTLQFKEMTVQTKSDFQNKVRGLPTAVSHNDIEAAAFAKNTILNADDYALQNFGKGNKYAGLG